MERAIHFSGNDYLYGLGLNRIEQMIIPHLEQIGINDAIEYYEIKQYFDEGAKLNYWLDSQNEEYQNKSRELFALTMRFFKNLDNAIIVDQFALVDDAYHESFWVLFDLSKKYDDISASVFDQMIHKGNLVLPHVLRFKSIVKKYGSVLRAFILEGIGHIGVVLSVYTLNGIEKDKLYLPEELTKQDICDYIEAYINCDSPSLNDLDTIIHMRNSKELPITDEIRLKAKRRYEKGISKITKEGISVQYGIKLSFSSNQKEEKKTITEGEVYHFAYSTEWLLDTLDYPSILNNFIYIFEFVDYPQMRCTLVTLDSQSGVFERAISSLKPNKYMANHAFHFKDALAKLQMESYYTFLQNNNIHYENVLKWFYTEYLQTEYNCGEIRVAFPSKETDYSEKCSIICNAFETVIKQFSLFVKHNEIDFDLLQMSTGSKKFGDIPSLIDSKYLYSGNQEFEQYKYYLFSDQCMLSFVKRIYDEKKQYKCFHDLITNESVSLYDYRENEQRIISFLKEIGLIQIDNYGTILSGDRLKLAIIKDLNENKVISRWHYPLKAQQIIKNWVASGILREKSSLLSEPEEDYFNYLLNHAEFTNGLDIRNKYQHGNQQVILDENIHKMNYMILLRIFTILTIKINDDFYLRQYLNAHKTEINHA